MNVRDLLNRLLRWDNKTELVLQVGDRLYSLDHVDGHDEAVFLVAGEEQPNQDDS